MDAGSQAVVLSVSLALWAGCGGTAAQPVAPSNLTYETNPAVLSFGAYESDVPSYGGGSASFSVIPSLPSGLQLDPVTGIISGIPAALASPSSYTVTVSNTAGSTTATVTISVILQPASRVRHTATLLPDGRVLIAGGFGGFAPTVLADAEIYDPSTGLFALTEGMTTPRENHTATLLPSGKVLIAGGDNCDGFLSSAETYDPATGVFSPTGSMANGRSNHSATLFPDGEVLLAGGSTVTSASYLGTQASAETYDPGTGTFTSTGDMTVSRAYHTATLLSTGRVLITGGDSQPVEWPEIVASAELYDPASRTFTATGNMNASRELHTASLLPDGQVLVVGGDDISQDLATTELYDPGTATFTWSGTLAAVRSGQTATLLGDGRVLVAGGSQLTSAEIYDPSTGVFTGTGSMATGRDGHTAALLPNGDVFIFGGWTQAAGGGWTELSAPELYNPGTGTFSPP